MQIDFTKLQGEFVRLEALNKAQVETLRTLARDPRLWEYTRTLLVNNRFDEQFDRYMANAFNPDFGGLQMSFVMRDRTTEHIMGMTRYYKLDAANKRLSIGYTWYAPAYWGRVHNAECKLLLVQYALETLGFQRVEFEVAHQNLRSQKAVMKIGGVKEGVLRKHGLMADGTVRDTVVFSIIDSEWPATKAALLALIDARKGTEKAAAGRDSFLPSDTTS